MKYVAIFMAALVLIGLVLGIFTLANTRMQVPQITLKAVSATERESEFAALQNAMDVGAAIGTPFTDSLPGTSLDYSFFAYAFRLEKAGLIGMEMVEIQPLPVNGDVLCYATANADEANANLIVPAGKERDAWCVLLTTAQNQESHLVTRTFRITYYVWGMAKSVTVTYN